MSYTALYRKYRPKVFSEVIGQEHITGTLTNQIRLGRVGHAYLFTGSRGTGKTTCAKIFARAVNCEKPDCGSPCGTCPVCESLSDPGNIDILEIDAASNNKVDEVREIRERVKYLPTAGKYKVYIIDEVHMLTDSAFNALLKTLEEPPPHVIFILATTEAHKLPQTILSRCMRFDFRLVGISDLKKQLKKIYDLEHKQYEEAAVEYIAAAAEGSVRDMLSIADMCFHFSDGILTYAAVLQVLGAADRKGIAELFRAAANRDTAGILYKIDEFAVSGKSMSLLAKDLAKYARDLLAVKAGGQQLVADTAENIDLLKEESNAYPADFLIYMISEFSKIDAELRFSVSPRIVLETAALTAAGNSGINYQALAARVAVLEENGAGLVPSESGTVRPGVIVTDGEETARIPVMTLESAVRAHSAEEAKGVWGRLVTQFRRTGALSLFTLLGEHNDYSIEGNDLVIVAADEKFLRFSDSAVIAEMNNALTAAGIPFRVRVEKRMSGIDMDREIERVKRLTGLEPKIEK